MKRISLLSITILILSGCNRLASIPYYPEQTPDSWLSMQPFLEVKLGATHFILVQPSSTIFVYLLGIVATGAGAYFLRIRNNQQSRKWWGIALLLWGFGALFAGTSYQAFSYEIKCAGQEFCSWTSWWEIVYLALSAASVDAMMVAVAHSCCVGKWKKALIYYAFTNIVLYVTVVLIGALSLNKFMISFELLLMVTAPNILALFVLNGWRYFKFKNKMDMTLLVTWVWLGITIGAYYLYLILDITDSLWERNIWFSENDVLHIGLISWMVFIAVRVANRITDQSTSIVTVS